MRFFLKIKAWQLFSLLFVLPFFVIPFVERFMFFAISVSTLVVAGLWYGWIWSVGISLNRRIAAEAGAEPRFFGLAANPKAFHGAAIYASLYIVFASFFFSMFMPEKMAIILPFHLLAMFCTFYMLYFTAKSYATYQKKRGVNFFDDYSGPFFLLWFFPIGIWFFQPKINRIFDGGTEQ